MRALTITAILVSVVLISGTLGYVISSPDAFAANEKVTLCHVPPGDPANAHTITVSASAVPAHLAHGDTLGPCEQSPTPDFLECFCSDGTTGQACIASCSANDLCNSICDEEQALAICAPSSNECTPNG